VAKKLAGIMGKETASAEKQVITEKQVAAVHCGADAGTRRRQAEYLGVQNCLAADMVGGGLSCGYGCLGFGDCFAACPFDAIAMVNGLPVIDVNKCTACRKCIVACPRQIISLRPADFNVVVACSSHDSGAQTRKNCPVGCIACKICEQEAPEVFRVIDNLSIVDYAKKGIDCSRAIEKCPTKCIK
jgi:ferredoxin